MGDCKRIIREIWNKVLARPCDSDTKVFFLKLLGDYYRYICENVTGSRLNEYKQRAVECYQAADQIKTELGACDPSRLGLALNYSLFLLDWMHDKETAIRHTREALEAAYGSFDTIHENNFKEARLIIMQLEENLAEWGGDD